MKISHSSSFEKRQRFDCLIIPVFKNKEDFVFPKGVDLPKQHFLKQLCGQPIKAGDFKGKEGDVAVVYGGVQEGLEARILLLGLGDLKDINSEKLRRYFSQATKQVFRYKIGALSFILPDTPTLDDVAVLRSALEGILLTNYSFDKLKSKKKEEDLSQLLEKIQIIAPLKDALRHAEKVQTICEGVYLARDLVNGNADDVTPQYLAKVAKNFEKNSKIKTTILDKKKLEEQKLGLLLAVSRGSMRDPVLIISSYKGDPKSKEHTVLVGKGVTFDTGGLNIKPTGSMETMKCDMGGAASVLATLLVAEKLGIKRNITAVVAATENAIGSRSYKPGDVYTSYLGKTVEIGNTDAEGRLILADALAYTVTHLNPTEIIGLATLTGAIDVALGSEASGLFVNDEKLGQALEKAGDTTFERVWRMPLFSEYKEALKSDIADLRNHGGRAAGATKGALFLEEFIGKDIPWAHIDIASTAYLPEPKRYNPKFATGVGVRLLIEFLENKA